MFTGLIEMRGEVVANVHSEVANRLLIRLPSEHEQQLHVGESIAVNGVCLTLLLDDKQHMAFDVSPETLNCTTIGQLCVGDCVNIERAMLATARFGGHYVSGHIDTTACIASVRSLDDYIEMSVGGFLIPSTMYLLPKGSITLDGVSLTINTVADGCIKVMLVPHTLALTTLGQLQVGQRLNVEFDYLTRIVAHQLDVVHATTLMV